MNRAALRLTARLVEVIILSAVAGLFIAGVGLTFGRLPLLMPALLGLLTGGVVTMPTFGLRIVDRRLRRILAAGAALLGLTVGHGLAYASFVHDQRAHHLAADYRLPMPEVDHRIDDSLRAIAGTGGFLGYHLATIELGDAVGPWRLAGLPLVVFRLLELSIAIGVAVHWAGGPPPPADQPAPD